MAVYLTHRHRGLALLLRSYRRFAARPKAVCLKHRYYYGAQASFPPHKQADMAHFAP